VITYGKDYSGAPIGDGITQKAGMEQPVYYWDPVIAPGGMVIYRGDLFPEYRGNVLVAGLVAQALVRLVLSDDSVTHEERIPLGARVRDVTEGPDGALYVVTDEVAGKLLRLTPAP
jgi:glucose/arabinose dehydrogenase